MRRWFTIFALVFAAVAPPAHADPIPADPALLQSCLSAASADRAALEACQGVVARPCIESEGPATMSVVLCWNAEADAWRDVIRAVSARRTETHPARDANLLKAANAAWSTWMDAECSYWSWEEGGGSGEQVDRVLCAARLSAERAITLMLAEDR